MTGAGAPTFLLHAMRIDLAAREVLREGEKQRLSPKAAAVLAELLAQPNRVCHRDDLLERVWPGAPPTSDALTHLVRELRKALGDDPREPRILETIPRVGYRLNGDVRVAAETDDRVALSSPGNDRRAASSSTEDAARAAPAIEVPERNAPLRVRRWSIPVAAVVVLALVVVWFYSRPTPASFVQATHPVALTSDPGSEHYAAISPDGALVAYVSESADSDSPVLLLKGRDPGALAVPLTAPRGPRVFAHLAWSPDGSRLLFAELDATGCTVRTVGASGGATRDLTPCEPFALDALDWSADGQRLFTSMPATTDAIARVIGSFDADSGDKQPLAYTPRAPDDVDLYPRVSPDGRWIAFRRGARPFSDLWLMPIDGGEARKLATLGSRVRGLAWQHDGSGVVFSSDHGGTQALYRVDLAGRVQALGIARAHYPSAAKRTPAVAFQQQVEITQLALFDLDAAGAPVGDSQLVAPSSRSDWSATLSPSGRKLVFVSERSGGTQLWAHDFDTGATAMLTDDAATRPQFPQWSADEAAVVYAARGDRGSELRRLVLQTRRIETLPAPDERVNFAKPSPDGEWIDYSSDRSGRWEAWRMRVDGSERRQLTHAGATHPRQFANDPNVYFSKPHQPGLFRIAATGGEESLVSSGPIHFTEGCYTVAGNVLITFTSGQTPTTATLRMQDLPPAPAAAGETRVVATLERDGAVPEPPLATFSADGRRVVATMLTAEGSDIFVTDVQAAAGPPEEVTLPGAASGPSAHPDR